MSSLHEKGSLSNWVNKRTFKRSKEEDFTKLETQSTSTAEISDSDVDTNE
jgi:hypothetical protein